MTRHEAAVYARVSVATIDRHIKSGALTVSRVGRRVLTTKRWVDIWLAELASE